MDFWLKNVEVKEQTDPSFCGNQLLKTTLNRKTPMVYSVRLEKKDCSMKIKILNEE